MKSILSKNQIKILDLISNEKNICRNFYLTGGTALAEYYLRHRLSEDLDFFSEKEFDSMAISTFFKKISKTAGITNIEYTQSFNRNIYVLTLSDDQIKTEFTFFPFERIELKNKVNDLYIDSLIDIAVNKIFTIYQKPRSRDFIDLYCILEKDKTFLIDGLVEKAQIKFDQHISPLNLSSQMIKAIELKDYPRLLIDLKDNTWQDFFIKKAKELAQREIK
jgi:predicted nucleotidyltransferase component of viral defense system